MRSLGAVHPDVLGAIEAAPIGGDTLVLRILHVLTSTDKGLLQIRDVVGVEQCTGVLVRAPPALAEVVARLYSSRIHDARLLVPVLSGLSKVLSPMSVRTNAVPA